MKSIIDLVLCDSFSNQVSHIGKVGNKARISSVAESEKFLANHISNVGDYVYNRVGIKDHTLYRIHDLLYVGEVG